jgi:HEAT repeat protein
VEEKVEEDEKKFIKWSDLVENLADDEPEKEELEAIISIIPKPYEFDNETSELICLLSDIEELGDHREIPFLTNLLLDETRPLISERIRDVIYGIEKVIDAANETVRPSVFEQLFNRSDVESKLILMDDIVAIGDEKEVYFMAQLLNDNNIEIRTKAESTLAALKERLSNENRKEMDIRSFDILNSFECSLDQKSEYEDLLTFTDEFILEPKTSAGTNQEGKSYSEIKMNSTFLSQLISIPNKLLAKLNG